MQEKPVATTQYHTHITSKRSWFSLNLKDDMLLIMTGTDPVEDIWAEIIEEYQIDGLDEIIADVNAALK